MAGQIALSNVVVDLAVAHANDPFGVGCDLLFVGDHHDGAALGVELVEERQDIL